MKRAFGPILVLLTMLTVAPHASAASISFAFNESGCCGTGPFGSVTISQTVAQQALGEVDVLVLLNLGNGFVATGSGNHPNFAWNLDPAFSGLVAGDITLLGDGIDPAGLPTGPWQWVFHGEVETSDNLGTFMYSYLCSDPLPSPNPDSYQRCGNGADNPNPGPLYFRITKAGLTLDDFVANEDGHYFVADILNGQVGGNGKTGLVWADGPGVEINDECTGDCGPVVPEPATLLLFGTGLAALAVRLRRARA